MVTLFIAEDDGQLRKFYKMALELKGYQILGMACNGLKAISMFKNLKEKPDVVILDHRMPDKNGIQILKEILKVEKTSKIILASADIKVKMEAILTGAKIFLEKPFSLKELYKSIDILVNRQNNDKDITLK